MIKTFTIDTDKWRLVPVEPTRDMVIAGTHQRFRDSYDAEEDCYRAMIAAAPQLEQVEFRDTCKNNGGTRGECQNESCAYEPKTKPVESEPVGYVDYGDRVEWYKKPIPETDLYTTPQPDRTAELEAELTALKAENESLKRDAERLDWMERKSEESRSGVTFQRVRYAEDGNVVESGYRVMSFHNVGELHQTLRVAIDVAMAQGEQGC